MVDEPTLPTAFAASESRPDRRYRLRADEPVADGIRRIARGQLADASDDLSESSRRELSHAVHETRKRIKRVRAALRLTRDAIGEPSYERENAAMRRTARRLAAGRDAQVLVETLDELAERFGDELPAEATTMLRARLETQRAGAELSLGGEDAEAVRSALADALDRAPGWTFDTDGFDALSPGLRRIYRRGRKRMRAAQEDPNAENLHEWRKRVKDLWHATQIVREAQPKRLKRVSKRAHKLANSLGDAHDLDVLRDFAEAHPQCFADEDSKQALLAVIDRRREALCVKALKRGRKLYEPKPKRFVKRIERGWRKRAAASPRPLAG